MVNHMKKLSYVLSATLCVALLPLAGCDKAKAPDQPATSDAASAPAKPAYVPPTAEQLYQMVGPIALFPDKLVAQVLAGSTYPDQITAADGWLEQNKSLTGVQLQNAANQQPWDVSVKGLTMFPNVLDQMAQNIQWTSALGEVYVNDPTDVMNAIQVMRQRASSSGKLKTTKQLRIAVKPRVNQAPPPDGYALEPGEQPVYSGPEVIPEPPEMIVIEPTEPDVVYVPTYDPSVVYGEPLPLYPGYNYAPPQPGYSTDEMVATGAISFGLGVAVGAVISNHDWGWNSWGMRWDGHRGDRGRDRGDWQRPAVVHNNSVYVSRSTTIINHVTNNNTNTRNITNNNFAPGGNNGVPNNARPGLPPGSAANANNAARPNFAPQNAQTGGIRPGARPEGAPGAGQPNFNGMNRPHAGQNGTGGGAGTPPVATQPNFNNMTKPNFSQTAPGAGMNQQHPNMRQPNPAELAMPHPNQGQHPEGQRENRPMGGTQVRPEMTRPPLNSGAGGPAHPEQRPPVQVQEHPQLQARPPVQVQEHPQLQARPPVQAQEHPQLQARPPVQVQERPQFQPRPPVQPQEHPQPPQPQPRPPVQAPQAHPQPHDAGAHPHPDKKDEAKHE